MPVALFPGDGSVLVIDNIEESGGVLLYLCAHVIVVVEDDDEGVLVEIVSFQSDGFPPLLELVEKSLYLLLFL